MDLPDILYSTGSTIDLYTWTEENQKIMTVKRHHVMRKARRRDVLFQTPGRDYAGGVRVEMDETDPAIGLKIAKP